MKVLVAIIMIFGMCGMLAYAFHRDAQATGMTIIAMTSFYWMFYLFNRLDVKDAGQRLDREDDMRNQDY